MAHAPAAASRTLRGARWLVNRSTGRWRGITILSLEYTIADHRLRLAAGRWNNPRRCDFIVGFEARDRIVGLLPNIHGDGDVPRACVYPASGRCRGRRTGKRGAVESMDRGVPIGARGDRASRRAVVRGRSSGAIDAGRESDQMASRTHNVVLRAIPARAASRGLPNLR